MAKPMRWLLGACSWYRLRFEQVRLEWWDRWRQRPVTGACPVAVSLTTHGSRLALVHIAILSIIAGSERPRRLILWLDTPPERTELPQHLRSLQQRGLEIRFCENFGPHTKYYPYVCQFACDCLPLVTADDDVIYTRHWLRDMWRAHCQAPAQIHCHLARRVQLQGEGMGPYDSWNYTRSPQGSPLNFALGFAGVIYPPGFEALLCTQGAAFRDACPRADDLWLHVMALRHGYAIHQIEERPHYPLPVPGSQTEALWHDNITAGGNDDQIGRTYGARDLDLLRQASHA